MKTPQEHIREYINAITNPMTTIIYHATHEDNLSSIKMQGIQPISYWAIREDIHEYYLETIGDENKNPITISMQLRSVPESAIEPDFTGIQEPLTYTLKSSEEEIWEMWEKSNKTWKDSLEIVGSIRITKTIPPNMLTIEQY